MESKKAERLEDHAPPAQLSFPASFGGLREARELVRSAARAFGFDEATCFQIKVAASEALANALEHGSPRGEEDEITISCGIEEGSFVVYVRDQGRFRHGFVRPSRDAARGRGFSFMAMLMDEVHIQIGQQGTLVRLVRRSGG